MAVQGGVWSSDTSWQWATNASPCWCLAVHDVGWLCVVANAGRCSRVTVAMVRASRLCCAT
eukprot:14848387-Alexandrium_andersonii.AAC.1